MRDGATDSYLHPDHVSKCDLKLQKIFTRDLMDWKKEDFKNSIGDTTMPDVVDGCSSTRTHNTVRREPTKLEARAGWFQLAIADASETRSQYTIASAMYNARPSSPQHRIKNGPFESFMRRHLRIGYEVSDVYSEQCPKC